MRLLAVECCGPLAKLSGKEGVVTHILPVVQKFSQVPARSCCDALFAVPRPLQLLVPPVHAPQALHLTVKLVDRINHGE